MRVCVYTGNGSPRCSGHSRSYMGDNGVVTFVRAREWRVRGREIKNVKRSWGKRTKREY